LIKQVLELLFGADPELRQIIGVTLRMSVMSTLISALIGIPWGVAMGANQFKGKAILSRITNTLMGLPPVVAGLIVFLVLSRSGPLGKLSLLYSVPAMVIAQADNIRGHSSNDRRDQHNLRDQRMQDPVRDLGSGRFRTIHRGGWGCPDGRGQHPV